MQKNYKITVLDKPYEVDGALLSEKTAIVTFYSEMGHEVYDALRLAFVETSEVYSWIKEEKPILLNQCYVKGFSLSAYRKQNQIEEDAEVKLTDLSAQGAFFDCEKDVDFSNSKFIGEKADFGNAYFGCGNVLFVKAKFLGCSVRFSETQFGLGDVNFQFVEFGDKNVSFRQAQFDRGDISFVNANFGEGKVSFKDCNFGIGDVSFHYAKIGDGDVSFEKSSFGGGYVDFRRAEFGTGRADFKRVAFGNGEVDFEEAEFKGGRVSFKSSTFGEGAVNFHLVNFGNEEAIFDKVNFGTGEVSFLSCYFNLLSFKGCHLTNYLDLRIMKGHTIDLSDTIVKDIIDMKPLPEVPVELKVLNIANIRNLGRIFIDWEDNDCYNMINAQGDKTTIREKSNQFNVLKEDFNSTGLYDDEDKAYVEFKRYELRADFEENMAANSINAIWVYPTTFFKWLVFDKVGLYATNPIRVLTSMGIVYTAFSLSYYFLPRIIDAGITCTGADNATISIFKETFYYSAITFLTIGYGDCLPRGHIHWLAPLEGFMGVFLMSYFTVAFVRKILR